MGGLQDMGLKMLCQISRSGLRARILFVLVMTEMLNK